MENWQCGGGWSAFRNRVEGAEPVLSYDLEYFQRFEPLTAGDALKRVPSVAFLSDVLESDGGHRAAAELRLPVAGQRTRVFDECELESEQAGPVFQLVARATF